MIVVRPEGPRLRVRIHGRLPQGPNLPDTSGIADAIDLDVMTDSGWVPALGRWTGPERGAEAVSRATDAGRFGFAYGSNIDLAPKVLAVSELDGGVLTVLERTLGWPLSALCPRPWPAVAVFSVLDRIGERLAATETVRDNAPAWPRLMTARHLDAESVWLGEAGQVFVMGYDPGWLFHIRASEGTSAGRRLPPPELARGSDVPSTDIYQLGVLGLDLLGALPTGTLPPIPAAHDVAWSDALRRLPLDVVPEARRLLAGAVSSWSGNRPFAQVFAPFSDPASLLRMVGGKIAALPTPTDPAHPLAGRELDIIRRLTVPPRVHSLSPPELTWALRPPPPPVAIKPDRWATLPFRKVPLRAQPPPAPEGDDASPRSDPAFLPANAQGVHPPRLRAPRRRRRRLYQPSARHARGVLRRRRPRRDFSRPLLLGGTIFLVTIVILGMLFW